jgi:hypothetical protein
MAGSTQTGMLKDSNVAQISAMLYYKASVLDKLGSSKAFKNKFTSVIFNQIKEDFGAYIDAQARMKPKSLHHVYEWGSPGVKTARLFKLKKLNSTGLSIRFDYEFIQSKRFVPAQKSKKKYVFANKAHIMEDGIPVIISPKASKRLVFEINDNVVFMPKGASVTVQRPGGKSATNQFKLAYSRFFSGPLVNLSIKKSNFQRIFNSDIAKALNVPGSIKKVQYRFSPNTIRMEADAALEMAFGGAL